MKTLIVGTGNPSKKQMIRSALLPLGIEILGTDDLNLTMDITEDGATAQENARKKSLAYTDALQRPVLSMDNALYFDGLPDDQQPGIDTRSVPGIARRATDEELLDHYARRIAEMGGETSGRWEFAVCIAQPDGRLFETTVISPRKFVSTPSPHRMPGYPLESLQIDPDSGQYIAEMSQAEQDQFWQKIIGVPLGNFVRDALEKIKNTPS